MTQPLLDPADATEFRRVLGTVPTSVAIIASVTASAPIGVSVGSFASASLDPPLVSFLIAKTSTSWPPIDQTGGFVASILSANQEPTSRLFATRGADKFAGCTWTPAPSGRPIIDGSVAWFDCDIDTIAQAGDHDLVLGRVRAMGADTNQEPLLFLGGRYGTISAAGGPAKDAETWGTVSPTSDTRQGTSPSTTPPHGSQIHRRTIAR